LNNGPSVYSEGYSNGSNSNGSYHGIYTTSSVVDPAVTVEGLSVSSSSSTAAAVVAAAVAAAQQQQHQQPPPSYTSVIVDATHHHPHYHHHLNHHPMALGPPDGFSVH